MSLRVLHVATATDGLAPLVVGMAGAQRARGNDVHVAAVASEAIPARLLDDLAACSIPAHPVLAQERDPRAQWNSLARLGRELRPDIVHTHGPRAGVLAAQACKGTGAAVVASLHGDLRGGTALRRADWIQRCVARDCDGIVAASEPMMADLLRAGIAAERVHVIPDAVQRGSPRLLRASARRILGIPDARWVVGWMGPFRHEAGADLALDALALLPDPAICLALFGDGPERARLERQARTLQVADRVIWCGAITDPCRFLPGLELLVVSARQGGSRSQILEAMSAVVPVVTTTAAGIVEPVAQSTAIAVAPEDPLAIAAAIHHVRAFPGIAARRALRAHVRWSRCADAERWAAMHARVYDAALGRRDRRTLRSA
jgi:glycosyltransferase involved in cell wall biosynthesis